MSTTEAEARAEGRREAAPAAFVALLVQVGLALISWSNGWELLGLPWWLWLLLATPSLLLMIDLVLSLGGTGLVRSRRGALVLLGLLVLGNFTALAILVAGLVSTTASDLTGSELLLTGFAIWTTNAIVFALLFWELEAGGPAARILRPERRRPRLPVPAGRQPAVCSGGLATRSVGLPIPLADELDRLQSNRHDAAVAAREGCDGPGVGNLCRDDPARGRSRRECTRRLTPVGRRSPSASCGAVPTRFAAACRAGTQAARRGVE